VTRSDQEPFLEPKAPLPVIIEVGDETADTVLEIGPSSQVTAPPEVTYLTEARTELQPMLETRAASVGLWPSALQVP